MSEKEQNAVDRIAELVPQMTAKQQEKLAYICEGIAMATEDNDERKEDEDDDGQ